MITLDWRPVVSLISVYNTIIHRVVKWHLTYIEAIISETLIVTGWPNYEIFRGTQIVSQAVVAILTMQRFLGTQLLEVPIT